MLRAHWYFSKIEPIVKHFVVFKSCSFSIWKCWMSYQPLTHGVCEQHNLGNRKNLRKIQSIWSHLRRERKSNSRRFRIFQWWFRIKNNFVGYDRHSMQCLFSKSGRISISKLSRLGSLLDRKDYFKMSNFSFEFTYRWGNGNDESMSSQW